MKKQYIYFFYYLVIVLKCWVRRVSFTYLFIWGLGIFGGLLEQMIEIFVEKKWVKFIDMDHLLGLDKKKYLFIGGDLRRRYYPFCPMHFQFWQFYCMMKLSIVRYSRTISNNQLLQKNPKTVFSYGQSTIQKQYMNE